MSGVKHLGGSGGVKIEIVGIASVVIPAEKAIVSNFVETDKNIVKEPTNGNIIKRSKGSYVSFSITFYNVEAADYPLLQLLGQIIGVARRDRYNLRVWPQYNTSSLGSVAYDCLTPDNWSFESIWLGFEGGQRIPNMEFEGASFLTQNTTHVDYTVATVRKLRNGDRRVTRTGDVRVIRG